jgi:hypothetical protein
MRQYETPGVEPVPPGHPAAVRLEAARPTQPGATPERFLCFYHGESMYPTLRDADLLEVEPVPTGEIRIGDVVVFPSPKSVGLVIHRVSALSADGLTTRGDAGPTPDPWQTPVERIRGRVMGAWRSGTRRKVKGGRPGCVVAILARERRRIESLLRPAARPLYGFLARTRLLARMVPPRYRPRMVTFRSRQGNVQRLYMGRTLIGWEDPQTHGWRITPWHRLLIDPARLMSQDSRRPARSVGQRNASE